MNETVDFYNLNDETQGLQRELGPGLNTRIFVGDQAMLSLVTFAPDSEGQVHSHPEEQWGVLLEGDGIRTQDGKKHPVKAGDFWCTPGDVSHGFRAGSNGARVLDIFAPPRESYKKPGEGFAQD